MNHSEWVAKKREEAAVLGLAYGDPHPETGLIWTGAQYHSPEAYDTLKRRNLLNMAKHRAKKFERDFNLTLEWLNAAWPADNRCPILGIELTWGDYTAGTSASIDRIDNAKGYTQDNSRVISWRANRIKCDATPEELQLVAADAFRLSTHLRTN